MASGCSFRRKKNTTGSGAILIESFADQSCLEIVLQEGRNRQIRRVAEQLGYPVIKLHRTAIGSIQLKMSKTAFFTVKVTIVHLEEDEISFLKKQIKQIPIKIQAELRRVEKA